MGNVCDLLVNAFENILQSRGWDIKNAIEWRKFVDGAI